MPNSLRLIKHNSKNVLAKAIIQYQQALQYYANESNWMVKEDDILWAGDDDPTLTAQVVLGLRKQPRPVTGQGEK